MDLKVDNRDLEKLQKKKKYFNQITNEDCTTDPLKDYDRVYSIK